MSASAPVRRGREPVLVDAVVERSRFADLQIVVTSMALTAIAAQIELPCWPVPVNGLPFAVLLVALATGWARSAIAMALYLALGLAGLPVFAGAASGIDSFGSPSTGLLVASVPVAAALGAVSARLPTGRTLPAVLASVAAAVALLVLGGAWLVMATALDPGAGAVPPILVGSVLPLLPGLLAGALLAAIVVTGCRRLLDRDRDAERPY
jgi:biotin transport system substrate-specific component